MQFSDPNDENSTATETKNYKHVTIDGTGYPNEENVLKLEQEFDTLEEAETELDKLLAAEGTVETASETATEPDSEANAGA